MQPACSESEDSFDFLFKIILVGDSDVGKTCLVQSFKSGIFMEKQQNTIGVDFTVRTMDIDGKKVKVGVQLVMFPEIIQSRLMGWFEKKLVWFGVQEQLMVQGQY